MSRTPAGASGHGGESFQPTHAAAPHEAGTVATPTAVALQCGSVGGGKASLAVVYASSNAPNHAAEENAPVTVSAGSVARRAAKAAAPLAFHHIMG